MTIGEEGANEPKHTQFIKTNIHVKYVKMMKNKENLEYQFNMSKKNGLNMENIIGTMNIGVTDFEDHGNLESLIKLVKYC